MLRYVILSTVARKMSIQFGIHLANSLFRRHFRRNSKPLRHERPSRENSKAVSNPRPAQLASDWTVSVQSRQSSYHVKIVKEHYSR